MRRTLFLFGMHGRFFICSETEEPRRAYLFLLAPMHTKSYRSVRRDRGFSLYVFQFAKCIGWRPFNFKTAPEIARLERIDHINVTFNNLNRNRIAARQTTAPEPVRSLDVPPETVRIIKKQLIIQEKGTALGRDLDR
jgi:hypothetical protein